MSAADIPANTATTTTTPSPTPATTLPKTCLLELILFLAQGRLMVTIHLTTAPLFSQVRTKTHGYYHDHHYNWSRRNNHNDHYSYSFHLPTQPPQLPQRPLQLQLVHSNYYTTATATATTTTTTTTLQLPQPLQLQLPQPLQPHPLHYNH